MEDESGGLLLLERHIRAGAGQIGQLPEDREFHPHVTFGRMRDENSREQRIIGARWLERGIPELPLWNVEKVTLFQSQTQRSGPIYSPLATFPLAGG